MKGAKICQLSKVGPQVDILCVAKSAQEMFEAQVVSCSLVINTLDVLSVIENKFSRENSIFIGDDNLKIDCRKLCEVMLGVRGNRQQNREYCPTQFFCKHHPPS